MGLQEEVHTENIMAEDMPSFILTQSQELQLFSDQDVGTMVHHLFTGEVAAEDSLVYQNEETADCTDQNEYYDERYSTDAQPQSSTSSLHDIVPIAPTLMSNKDFSGPFNFSVSITPQTGNCSWVYSEKLNKIYTMASQSIPVDFKLNSTSKTMFVRATPLYSALQYAQELVKRCLPHSSPSDPSNLNFRSDLFDHILRCQNSKAFYYGSVESKIFLNVIVPLEEPQAGTDIVRVMYSFVCNNSCPSGMNRKALEVVFTLEDAHANVYGRKKVFVRVCSCPKRDKEKEEKCTPKHPSSGKKHLKSEKKPYSLSETALDTTEYNININICGKRNRYRLVRTAYEMVTTLLSEHGPNAALKANQEDLHNYLKSLD